MIPPAIAEFAAAKRVLLLTHLRPDGDALGSSFGLRQYFRDNGADAETLIPGALPERYRELCREPLTSLAPEELERFDLIVTLDCANAERLGHGPQLTLELLKSRRLINIDHHGGNSLGIAPAWIDGSAASTCTMVTELLLAAGGRISPECATLLLAGMMTDTGCFCFANTDGRALRAAAELADRGAGVEKVANALFFSKPLNQIRFEADLVQNHLVTACDGKFAYIFVPDDLPGRYGFDLREDEGLIDIARQVRGAVIAMLCHRRADGFRVSLRSKDRRYPVGPIARKFGGGGHEMAAGCTLNLPDFPAVESTILPEILLLFSPLLLFSQEKK